MFSQNLPISAAFTAVLKTKLLECNAIGVRSPPGLIWGTAVALLTHCKGALLLLSLSLLLPHSNLHIFDQITAFCFYYSFPTFAFSLYHPPRGSIVKLIITSFLKILSVSWSTTSSSAVFHFPRENGNAFIFKINKCCSAFDVSGLFNLKLFI